MDGQSRNTAYNTGFASGGVMCKLGALCFYSSVVLVDSFVLRNPPERKARKRCFAMPRSARHCETTGRRLHLLLSLCLRFASALRTTRDLQKF
jgi:hypothetical protein